MPVSLSGYSFDSKTIHMSIRFYIAGLLILLASTIEAADFRSNGSVVINTPQRQDLYIIAGTVVINAPVYGDVIIMGGDVTINDSVTADVMIAGGKVNINGHVGDDIRCLGGRVSIAGYAGGDIVAAGGIITTTSKSSAASIIATGGNLTFMGEVRESLTASASNIMLDGMVNGNIVLKGGTIIVKGVVTGKASLAASKDIKILKGARIGRSIKYWLPLERPLEVPPGVMTGKPVYTSLLSITHSRWYFLGASTFLGLLWYLGMAFILILLLQYFFSGTLKTSGIKFHSNPVRSFLTGAAYFVCVPLGAVLLLLTIIGLPLTVLILFFYAFSLLLATIISSVVIVNWVAFISDREFNLMKMSAMGLFTFILLKIITFTPFFGSVVMVAIAATSFGSIVSSIKWKQVKRARNPTSHPLTITHFKS